MKKENSTYRVAFLGINGALALVLGFLEHMLIPDRPFLPVGAKPGLSNIVTMYVTDSMGVGGGLCITFIKAAFALITRGATASAMSFCGGLLSTVAVAILLKHRDRLFSFVGIGIVGALMHNFGQLFVACLISGTPALFSYGKYLMIFALITGTVTGGMLTLVMPKVERINSQFSILNSQFAIAGDNSVKEKFCPPL